MLSAVIQSTNYFVKVKLVSKKLSWHEWLSFGLCSSPNIWLFWWIFLSISWKSFCYEWGAIWGRIAKRTLNKQIVETKIDGNNKSQQFFKSSKYIGEASFWLSSMLSFAFFTLIFGLWNPCFIFIIPLSVNQYIDWSFGQIHKLPLLGQNTLPISLKELKGDKYKYFFLFILVWYYLVSPFLHLSTIKDEAIFKLSTKTNA